MTPLLVMGVICKNVIPCKDYQQDDDARSDIVTLIVLQDNIHVLSVKWSRLVWDMMLWIILSFKNGKCIEQELCKQDVVTGLYPYMTLASSRHCRLCDVYSITVVRKTPCLEHKYSQCVSLLWNPVSKERKISD